MSALTPQNVEEIIKAMARVAIENEDEFSRLDGVCGDGDFGASLAAGFKAILDRWDEIDASRIQPMLMKCGMLFTSQAGGCSGPLWGTAFMKSGMQAKDLEALELSDLVAMSEAAQAAMMQRGGARIGDKTMLDAIDAATESLRQSQQSEEDLPTAFARAAKASENITETAKAWIAQRGRQSFTGERSKGTYDPGMVAITKILQAVAQIL